MELKNIVIHHFGGTDADPLAKTGHLTEQDINNAHRSRWPDFPSEFNDSHIGYNAILFRDGTLKQFRYIGEETAAQKSHNLDSVSICLAGNFTQGVEVPTIEQKMKLKSVIQALLDNAPERVGLQTKVGTILNLSRDRIYPHRALQPTTDCYGRGLSDSWARELVSLLSEEETKRNLLITLIGLYQKLIELLKKQKLGNQVRPCSHADVRG